MPIKIRKLKQLLLKSGFICKHAKGSHEKWIHPDMSQAIIIAGKDGADAKPYAEKQVISAIAKARAMQKDEKK